MARGRDMFHGSGNCAACHGIAGVGTDSGPALAQGVWMHGPDTFEGILGRVIHGLPKAWSTRGVAMPMRGWTALTDRRPGTWRRTSGRSATPGGRRGHANLHERKFEERSTGFQGS